MTWDRYLAQFPPVTFGFISGPLPDGLRDGLRAAVENAPKMQFSTAPIEGVEVVQIKKTEVEQLNRDHSYRNMDEPTKAAVSEILEHLKVYIASLLGTPWRALNVRSWTTKKGAQIGPNAWHTDGDHPGILKLMLYGTPTGGEYGGIECEHGQLRGEAWLLFRNSVVQHRAVAPSRGGIERVATEVTLCQSNEFDLEPKFLGLSARKPTEP